MADTGKETMKGGGRMFRTKKRRIWDLEIVVSGHEKEIRHLRNVTSKLMETVGKLVKEVEAIKEFAGVKTIEVPPKTEVIKNG